MSKPSLPVMLVVDDESALRMLLAEFFKHQFKCVPLQDGIHCLPYMETNPRPALLILDLEMPRMGGLEVIRQLRVRKEWEQLVIVVLSSKESSKDRIECLSAGADDFVVKPFNPAELDARIRSIFRRINFTEAVHGRDKSRLLS